MATERTYMSSFGGVVYSDTNRTYMSSSGEIISIQDLSGGATEVNATLGTITISGLDATVTANTNINATVATLTISGHNAEVSTNTDVNATTGTIVISGLDAIVTANTGVNATLGTIEISALDATVAASTYINATTGTITISGLDATVQTSGGVEVSATLATIVISAHDATVTANTDINATVGTVVVKAFNVTVDTGQFVSEGPGAFLLDDLPTFFDCDIELNLENDLDTFLNMGEFSMTAEYTPTGGGATVINVIYNPEEIEIDPYTAERAIIPPKIWCKTSDVDGIRHKDAITVDSTTFEVTRHFNNHGITEIILNKV